MRIKDLMTKNPAFCLPKDTAFKAVQIMKRHKCGVVPVVENRRTRRLRGILTDRDLALFLGRSNKPAKKVQLREFSQNKVRAAHPEDSLRRAIQLLERGHLHRLPVVDRQNRLQGILSLKDLAEEAYKERNKKTHWVKEKDLVNILESISRSR